MDEKQGRQDAMTSYGLARVQYDLNRLEPLLRLGRALADPMRIRILALLAQRYRQDTEQLEISMYGQEIAEALRVTPPCGRTAHARSDRRRAARPRPRRASSPLSSPGSVASGCRNRD